MRRYDSLIELGRQGVFTHPLTNLTLRLMVGSHDSAFYPQTLSSMLFGPRIRPYHFLVSSCIVATDILEVMTCNGLLTRDGLLKHYTEAEGGNQFYSVNDPRDIEPLTRQQDDPLHPYADEFVLGLFKENPAQDRMTVAPRMGLPNVGFPARATKAYKDVATDILERLRKRKLLVQDGAGWYFLKRP